MANSLRCPLCASAEVKTYMESEQQTLDTDALGPSRSNVSFGRILRCQACAFGFRQTRPKDEELSTLYRELDNEAYDSEVQGRSKTAVRHLRIMNRYLSPGHLLDVGCASGIFLRLAAGAGWTVVGVEPSRSLCDRAKEVLAGQGELICSTLQESCLPASSFDAVTLWDVLEHVPDPAQFFLNCASLLRPGGHLFVNVPDLDSLQSRVLGVRWPLFLPEHLNYFNRDSLKLCGQHAKLTWLHFGRRSATFSIEYLFYRLAQHHIPGASMGRRLTSRLGIGGIPIRLPMGELYGVWKR